MCILMLTVSNVPFYSHPFVTFKVFKKWRNQKVKHQQWILKTFRRIACTSLFHPCRPMTLVSRLLKGQWLLCCTQSVSVFLRFLSGSASTVAVAGGLQTWSHVTWSLNISSGDTMLLKKQESKELSSQGGGSMKQGACCSSEVTGDQLQRWLVWLPDAGVAISGHLLQLRSNAVHLPAGRQPTITHNRQSFFIMWCNSC